MLAKTELDLVEKSIKDALEPLGFVLIELKQFREFGSLVLRLLVDRVSGGISLGECADISYDIGLLFDEKNLITEKYTLEVSSPGIDRPLVNEGDFKRAVNKKIHIFLKEQVGNEMEWEGALVSVDSEGIKIVSDEEQENFIPFLKIIKAKQVI